MDKKRIIVIYIPNLRIRAADTRLQTCKISLTSENLSWIVHLRKHFFLAKNFWANNIILKAKCCPTYSWFSAAESQSALFVINYQPLQLFDKLKNFIVYFSPSCTSLSDLCSIFRFSDNEMHQMKFIWYFSTFKN